MLLWRSLAGLDKVTGAMTLAFSAIGIGAWQQLLPWWLPFVAFGFLLFYGFLKSNYEEYLVVEGERNWLLEGRANTEKRIAVKNLLAEAADQAEALKSPVTDPQDIMAWVQNTHDLIEAAFDKGAARSFISDKSSNIYRPPNPYALGVRLKRLDELIDRANSFEINPNFDPQNWTDRR